MSREQEVAEEEVALLVFLDYAILETNVKGDQAQGVPLAVLRRLARRGLASEKGGLWVLNQDGIDEAVRIRRASRGRRGGGGEGGGRR